MSEWVRRHLYETMLPFWARRAYDSETGGFVSALSMTGERLPETMRACLIQSRCLYSFSHAAVQTGESWAQEAAERAFTCLMARFRHGSGLWVTAASPRPDGPRDERLDFYDQAFILFSLGWWARISDRAAALELAEETFAALEAVLGDGEAGGWREDDAAKLPRRQNPHMHLLEAMHALHEAGGGPVWLERAERIVSLFLARFFDAETATVREFLTGDLEPATGDPGLLREPGHAMEWVWLLLHHHRLTGNRKVLGPAQELYRAACRHGCDSSGHLVEITTPEGRVLDASHLLWPQTEAVKAALAMHEFAGCPAGEAEAFLQSLRRTHLRAFGPLWLNRLTPQGEALTEIVPTRLLYHLVLCMTEYLRVAALPNSQFNALHEEAGSQTSL